MVERNVKVVDEAIVYDVPTIESIGHLELHTESTDNGDVFSKKAEELKALNGTSTGFKRSVTNKINKTYTGAGDARSQKIEPEAEGSFISGYQMFDVVEPPYNMDYLAKLYELSSPHYAAVNAKVANIVGLGYKLIETTETKRQFEQNATNEAKTKKARQKLEAHRDELMEALESFNEEDTVIEILTKVWRDYEVIGNGYLEVGRKKDGTIGYIGHIPAQTMRIRKKRDGFVQIAGHKVQFFNNFSEDSSSPIGGKNPNQVIHIKRYSPTSGFYGIPDIVAAKQAVAGNEFSARFNLDYFENKAVPRHVIILKGAKLGASAERSLLEFFETGLKGQHHRSLYVPLPSGDKDNPVDLSIEAVENGIQDASFVNYRKANLADILMSHRVPISKIGLAEGISLAAARDADKTFKEQVCSPEQKVFEKKFNRIIKELTTALEFKLNEMTLTDADTQSKIDERMVKAGIWLPNEPRTRDGMTTVSGGEERVDLNAKDKISQQQAEATTIRQRDSERSAGATDSAGEGRASQGDGRTTP